MKKKEELCSFPQQENSAVEETDIRMVPIAELQDFEGHPFKVENDMALFELMQSIEKEGVIVPVLARPKAGGGYELIAGHRRKAACKWAGLEVMPVVIRDLDDNQAVIAMVDSNLQREHLKPSEKAFAYKMKLEAMKRFVEIKLSRLIWLLLLILETEDFMRNTDKKKGNMVLMSMRISAEDKELIEEKARKTGLSISEFIRRCALGRKLPCYGDTSLLKEYAMQLGKIGSNLNQIAKYLNSGGNYFSIYFELKEAMKELLDLKFKILPALEDVVCGRKYRRKGKKESEE